MSEQAKQDDGDLPPGAVRVTLRRAPRFRPFVVTGAVVGVLVGLLIAVLAPGGQQQAQFSKQSIFGYFGATGLLIGAVLGGVLAVLADRRR